MAVLDSDPDVVLAYTQAKAIDDQGQVVKVYPGKQHYASPTPRIRRPGCVLAIHHHAARITAKLP